jgi:hypothetical protein
MREFHLAAMLTGNQVERLELVVLAPTPAPTL